MPGRFQLGEIQRLSRSFFCENDLLQTFSCLMQCSMNTFVVQFLFGETKSNCHLFIFEFASRAFQQFLRGESLAEMVPIGASLNIDICARDVVSFETQTEKRHTEMVLRNK